MQYDVEINGRVRRVVVRRAGDGFAVAVDDRAFHVDAARVDAHTLSLVIGEEVRPADTVRLKADTMTEDATIEDATTDPVVSGFSRTGTSETVRRTYEVTVAAGAASSDLAVGVGSTPFVVGFSGVNGRRGHRTRDAGSHKGTGPQRVVAPMPGKIVRVLIHPGQAVVVRQPLVVVEAMKMENELRAGREGTVAEIHAREGESVDAGALLVVIQ